MRMKDQHITNPTYKASSLDSMEITSAPEECCVCGRQLANSRWVKASNHLRHSGREVAEALQELLVCEAQLSWVCFRCYRLVLGLDYHTHQLEKQRLALLRLYDGKNKTEQSTNDTLDKKTLYAAGGGGCGSVGYSGGCSEVKEVLDNLRITQDRSGSSGHVRNVKEQKLDHTISSDTACKADSQVLPYPLQSVCDHEYYMNNDQGNLSGKSTTVVEGHDLSSSETLLDPHCTKNLESGTMILSVKDGITQGKQKLNTGSSVPRTSKYSTSDSLVQDYETHCCKQEEIAPAPAVPPSQRLVARRRKTSKKWDDFEYYEDESKTTEVECDKIDTFPPAHQFRLPPRTEKKRCHKCKQEFATKKAILNHKCSQMKRVEREKVRYKCKGCMHIFHLRREYIKHANACYKNTPVTCNLCLVKLPSAAYLPRHLAALHQVKSQLNKGDILCELCGRGFSRKEALERHEARVHEKAHGSHQCPQCGHTFLHTSLLAEHLRAHQGYTCPECSKVFSCRSNLTLHRRAHHMRKTAYHCAACNRHWKFHASYIYHMKKFHRSSEYKCPGCRLLLYSEEALNQHSMTCGGPDTSTSQSTEHQEACNGRRQNTDGALKQPSNTTADALVMTRYPSGPGSLCSHTQLTKGTDGLGLVPEVRNAEIYEPQNSFPQGPPTCEIVVEVLEETDADWQYIILIEDVADAHLSISDASMWNTQRQ